MNKEKGKNTIQIMHRLLTRHSIILTSAAIFLSACSGADNGVVPVTVADETTGVTAVGEISTVQETVTDSADHVETIADDTSVEDTTEEYTEYTTTEPVETAYVSAYHGEYGSAGALEGRTVVVSIITNDRDTSWAFLNGEVSADVVRDRMTMKLQRKYLLQACDWLSQQAAYYGKKAEFIADWEEYLDLCYEYDTTQELVRFDGSMYDLQRSFVCENIPSEELKERYEVDNIIYIFYFNTDTANDVNPWSLTNVSGGVYDIELINMFVGFDTFSVKPCTYAHEMLHCFGAYDLYYSNSDIPQEYVDHLAEIGSEDIMYMVYDSEEILNELGEPDAYYVGLCDTCDEVEEWGLPLADRFE